ncbi:MAG: hypothetical protein ABMB14_41385 [Myxococcota bacterium]
MSSADDRSAGTAAGALMIGSGVFTVLASFGLFFTFVWVCVGVFWLIPMAVGVGEIAVGAAIMGGRPNHRVRGMSVAGLLSALLCGNLLGVGMELGALVLMARASEPSLLEG